jgi:Rrf2 family transcriptional regulator, cysteine metabolism repressor
MKLSTKGRYSVRLMLDLAMHDGEGPILLKDIAERQAISEKYLWQLIPPLKNLGLVTSFRGAHGGYTLAKTPAEINLQDIVTAVEGPLSLVDCVDDPKLCARVDTCVSRAVWQEVSEKILQILASFTLATLIERQRTQAGECNYVI